MPMEKQPDTTLPQLEIDYVLPFQLEGSDIRGRVVKLNDSITTIINQQAYPQVVSSMMAEFLGLTVILASMLKYDGIFTLQIQGEGPVSLMVADLTSEGAIRGYARFDESRILALSPEELKENPVQALLQNGTLHFTVDQGQFTERYQSIVSLTQSTLAKCVNHYFEQSEQFKAILTLAVGSTADTTGIHWHCGGMVLQALPLGPEMSIEEAEESWNRAHVFLLSITDQELLSENISGYTLLYRLFHEDKVRVFDPKTIQAKCRCSKDKLLNVLHGLDEKTILELETNNIIASNCEFCGNLYEISVSEILKNKNATVH